MPKVTKDELNPEHANTSGFNSSSSFPSFQPRLHAMATCRGSAVAENSFGLEALLQIAYHGERLEKPGTVNREQILSVYREYCAGRSEKCPVYVMSLVFREGIRTGNYCLPIAGIAVTHSHTTHTLTPVGTESQIPVRPI